MEKFTAVFEQEGRWWIGYVEELPGANTQGQTLEANRELARRETEGKDVIREELMVAL